MQTRSYLDGGPAEAVSLRVCEIIISDIFLA